MADAVAERINRYILDGSDEDLRRLLGISQLTADAARAAFARVGVRDGWRVVDCGCGPLGALAVMAGVVGPTGQAVGIDFNRASVERARSVISELGLRNVSAVVGDVNAADIETLAGGGFDLAFTRCFLMHQAEPRHTLTQIAKLVRAGGWIVLHEPMRSPPPRSHPQLDALGKFWELLQETMERAGAQRLGVENLPASARAAGLEVVSEGGFFRIMPPAVGFEVHAGTLAAAKARAIQLGVASESDIDAVVNELRAAKNTGYEWVSSPFLLDLVLRRPSAADATNSGRLP